MHPPQNFFEFDKLLGHMDYLYLLYLFEILEVNSQTKYEFYISIDTLQIVSSMCSLQMCM